MRPLVQVQPGPPPHRVTCGNARRRSLLVPVASARRAGTAVAERIPEFEVRWSAMRRTPPAPSFCTGGSPGRLTRLVGQAGRRREDAGPPRLAPNRILVD